MNSNGLKSEQDQGNFILCQEASKNIRHVQETALDSGQYHINNVESSLKVA